jgi:hypothetical protein
MTKKAKMRDLLCAGLNEVLYRGLIKLENLEDVEGELTLELFGKNSKIIWIGIGYDEIRISLWWGIKRGCKMSTETKPFNSNLRDALDVCCSAWLERRKGFWLQGTGGDHIFDTYCARSAEADLNRIPIVEPSGYKKEGKFFL